MLALSLAGCGGGTEEAPEEALEPCRLLRPDDFTATFGENYSDRTGEPGRCSWTLESGAAVGVEIIEHVTGEEAQRTYESRAKPGAVDVDLGRRGAYDERSNELLVLTGRFVIRVTATGRPKNDADEAVPALGRVLAELLSG